MKEEIGFRAANRVVQLFVYGRPGLRESGTGRPMLSSLFVLVAGTKNEMSECSSVWAQGGACAQRTVYCLSESDGRERESRK